MRNPLHGDADGQPGLVPGIFRPMGIDGVYARTAMYAHVFDAVQAYISGMRPAQAMTLRFPPVMSRSQLEKSGYLSSFPNLLGCVCSLHGTESAIRAAADRLDAEGGWTDALTASDMVLTPAACYPLYPMVAAWGRLPPGGLVFDIEADCFRREPSQDLDRLQSFRMREFVRIGAPEAVVEFREEFIARAARVAGELALPHAIEVASDPFFGRVGRIKAVSQRQQTLKFELLIPFQPGARPTACMSFNYHRDHFGQSWNIRDSADATAHTGCVAFGVDRLTVALFAVHGLEFERWPENTRKTLSL